MLEKKITALLKEGPCTRTSIHGVPSDIEEEPCSRNSTTVNGRAHDIASASLNWTRVHSHFALMGGLVFNLETMGVLARSPYIGGNDMTQLYITTEGLCKIVEYEPALLRELTRDMIEDKSKANGFAKFIVCVQVSWFLIQTTGRLITRHPISLLELNTSIHALCCLGNYIAWWYKPLDIERPFSIDLSNASAQKLCAWMVMSTTMGCRRENFSPETIYRELILEVEEKRQVFESEHTEKTIQALGRNKSLVKISSTGVAHIHRVDIEAGYEAVIGQGKLKKSWKLNEGETLFGFRLRHKDEPVKSAGAWTELSSHDVRFLKLARDFRVENKLNSPWQSRLLLEGSRGTLSLTKYADVLAHCTHSGTFHGNSELAKRAWHRPAGSHVQEYFLLISTILGTGLYGGLHLLAWNSPFASEKLRLGWRLSAITIASPLPIFIVTTVIGHIVKFLYQTLVRPYLPSKRSDGWNQLVVAGFYFITTVCFFLTTLVGFIVFPCYQFARIWLVVGCFINLNSLPKEVFKETDWGQMIPHFGAD